MAATINELHFWRNGHHCQMVAQLGGCGEVVTSAADKERRGDHMRQVCNAQFFGLGWWVQRITHAHQPGDTQWRLSRLWCTIIAVKAGNGQRTHSPTHRAATDHQLIRCTRPSFTRRCHGITHAAHEHRRAIGGTAPRQPIRKVDSRHG